jgi:hypothetical protein
VGGLSPAGGVRAIDAGYLASGCLPFGHTFQVGHLRAGRCQLARTVSQAHCPPRRRLGLWSRIGQLQSREQRSNWRNCGPTSSLRRRVHWHTRTAITAATHVPVCTAVTLAALTWLPQAAVEPALLTQLAGAGLSLAVSGPTGIPRSVDCQCAHAPSTGSICKLFPQFPPRVWLFAIAYAGLSTPPSGVCETRAQLAWWMRDWGRCAREPARSSAAGQCRQVSTRLTEART